MSLVTRDLRKFRSSRLGKAKPARPYPLDWSRIMIHVGFAWEKCKNAGWHTPCFVVDKVPHMYRTRYASLLVCRFDPHILYFSSPLHKGLKQRQQVLDSWPILGPKRLFSECCNLDIHAITRAVQSDILPITRNGWTERCLKLWILEHENVGLTKTRALSWSDPFHWIRLFSILDCPLVEWLWRSATRPRSQNNVLWGPSGTWTVTKEVEQSERRYFFPAKSAPIQFESRDHKCGSSELSMILISTPLALAPPWKNDTCMLFW